MALESKILVIYCNPFAADSAYSKTLVELFKAFIDEAKNISANIDLIDLQKDVVEEGFSPWAITDSKITKHLEYQIRIRRADQLVFLYPLINNHVPAILKGFLDTVFIKNFAYKKWSSGMNEPMLSGKSSLNIIFSPENAITNYLVWSGNLKIFWERAIFRPSGISSKTRIISGFSDFSKQNKQKLITQTKNLSSLLSTKESWINLF